MIHNLNRLLELESRDCLALYEIEEFRDLKSKIQALIEDGEKWRKIEKQAGMITLDHLQTDGISTLDEYSKLKSQIKQLTSEKKQLEELLDLKNRTIKSFDDKLSQTEKQLEQHKAVIEKLDFDKIEELMVWAIDSCNSEKLHIDYQTELKKLNKLKQLLSQLGDKE